MKVETERGVYRESRCDRERRLPRQISDPVLEARRRKFESTKPIDPINVNKKIKLSKKGKHE